MPTRVTTIWLHADNPYQEVQCIGASDGVGIEVVGGWRNGEDREKVAQLLFDTKFDDQGFPCGVGLSSWRFRLGSGSLRTNEGAQATQLDTYLREDWATYGLDDFRGYDFNRCAGQQWFLQTANKYHVPSFTACSHAPPYPLVPSQTTQNPYSCNLWDNNTLLSREYATYLTKICRHFNSLGVCFKAISPVRTTHTGGGVVEGCRYTHQELLTVLQCLDEELSRLGMGTDIVVPDSISLDFLTSCVPGKEDNSDFLYAFFGGKNPHALQRMKMITSASYLTCWPEGDRLVASRTLLGAQMQRLTQKFGVAFGVSEYSVRIPEKDARIPKDVRRKAVDGELQDSTDINSALWCARVIQADLAISCASSWHYTDAISTEFTRDGLIEIDTRHEGYFRPTKMLWVLGHFSLFIRPGMTRIRVTRDDGKTFRDCLHELLTTAYLMKSSFTVVFVNYGEYTEHVSVEFRGSSKVINCASCFRSYVTNEDASLSTLTTSHLGAPFTIPPRSVVTCTGTIIEEDVNYQLEPQATEKQMCLQVTEDREGSVAGLGYTDDLRHQRWNLIPCDGEYVMLMNMQSSMVLTAKSQAGQQSLPVHQEFVKSEKKADQLWGITYTKCGGYIFRNAGLGLVLEYYGDSVRLAERTGKATQQWNVVAVTQHKENLPHLIQEKKPQALLPTPKKRPILTPKHEDLAPAEWKGTRPDYVNNTLVEPPGPPKIVQVAVPMKPLFPQGRYSHAHEAEQVQAPPHVQGEPAHYVKPESPMEGVRPLGGPGAPSWPAVASVDEVGDEAFTPVRVAKSSSFKRLSESHFTPRTKLQPSPYDEVASPHTVGHSAPVSPSSHRLTHPGASRVAGSRVVLQHPAKHFGTELVVPTTQGALPFSTRSRLTSSVMYDTTFQSEIDKRREENETIRKKMQAEKEMREREETSRRLQRDAEMEARAKADKEEQEEALRAQRRGTSHLVFSLAMTRSEFDHAFQKTLGETIAKKLNIAVNNVIVTFLGQEAKSIKVEVRLRGIPNAGDRLDELFEAVSVMDKPNKAVGDEGLGSDDSAESSSDDNTKRKSDDGKKRARRHKKKRHTRFE